MTPSDPNHDSCLRCGGGVPPGGQALAVRNQLGERWVYWLCPPCYAAEVTQQKGLSPALAGDEHQVAIAMWARVSGWAELAKMHERHPAPHRH